MGEELKGGGEKKKSHKPKEISSLHRASLCLLLKHCIMSLRTAQSFEIRRLKAVWRHYGCAETNLKALYNYSKKHKATLRAPLAVPP